jgi:serine/threonine protein kinase/Tol biopolymer transport system component
MTPEQWKHINELFHAMQELASDKQAAFLQANCADDDFVRTQVRALLAVDESAAHHLETPAFMHEVETIRQEQGVLSPKRRLGHYEILAPLGAGGMGEVWLARDTRFSSQARVAIKTLPIQFTQDPERLKRFINEANATSALNHQNIIKIFDIGEETTEAGTLHFIATEYIDGITLRERMNQSEPIAISEALNIAAQIAAALDAAHHAGVIHRDIKPENVMLQADGFVKVLDFGLAKLMPAEDARFEKDTGSSAVSAEGQTLPGMLIGTLRYMSPEQARGVTINHQTDLFSLGVVLYEMLIREPLFAGETKADVLAAILRKEAPPLSDYLKEPPAELERIVHRALAKEVRDRYQTARDLQIDLQELRQVLEMEKRLNSSGRHSGTQHQPLPVKQSFFTRLSLRPLWLLIPLALTLIGAIWWLFVRLGGQVDAPPPASLVPVEVAKWQGNLGEVYSEGKFSPDGNWVAFTSTQGGGRNIWFKLAAGGDPIPSTADEFLNEQPLWSPTGNELAFRSQRGGTLGIWRKTLSGGTPVLLRQLPVDANDAALRYWSKSDTIYFESKGNFFAFTVGSEAINKLTNFDSNQLQMKSFSPSPDEKWIVYRVQGTEGRSEIIVLPMQGGPPKRVTGFPSDTRNIVWHPDSQRLFFSAKVNKVFQVFVGDLAGHVPQQLTFGETDYLVTDVSSDGTRILYGTSKEASDIWGIDRTKAQEFVVASDIDAELWPDVSVDNKTIAYQSFKGLNQGNNLYQGTIITKALPRTAPFHTLAANGYLPKLSPDGKRIAFIRLSHNASNLWVTPTTGGAEQQLTQEGCVNADYTVTPYNFLQASYFAWSPDSQSIAYLRRKDGRKEMRLVNTVSAIDKAIPTTDDLTWSVECPLWSSDGQRIAWSSNRLNADGKQDFALWVTDIKTQTAKQLYLDNTPLRLLGWSSDDESLIVAYCLGKPISRPTAVKLSAISEKKHTLHQIAELPLTYYFNIRLSPDRRSIAYVGRQEEKDNLWWMQVSGGQPVKMTSNNDPHLYFSSFAWAPDSRTLYFGKQTRHNLLFMLTNF